ncbi:hypothetical protein B0H14DRAFT_3513840 [Mycena olivaceomarginata]|nr:hypothetical protein B0H14DRAFT_3513840 [Mycena olivaceomarginata]
MPSMDAWDGDTDKLSAQDFLRAFHREQRTTASADKAKTFKNYLVSGSEVDIWYKGLGTGIKADMDQLEAALEAKYPEQESVQPTKAEYEVMLTREKLKEEDLGKRVKVADKEVWAHHAWATKMARLANNAGVAAGSTYMEQVRLDLPSQIRSKIGKGHTNWAAFLKAVRDVDPSDLEVEMKEWRAKKEEIDTLKKHQAALQASPTAGIRAQLAGAAIGPRTRKALPTPSKGGEEDPATYLVPHGNKPRPLQQQREIQQPLAGADRATLVAVMARIVHHPDTPAGHQAHADQQQAWYAAHRNIPISVNTPYPLKPGRAPANSGECFRCGYGGHTNFQRGCTTPEDRCLSWREQAWRRIATQALREPIPVRMVEYEGWADVDNAGRPFGGDTASPEDVSPGPQLCSNTLSSIYASPKFHIVDLYAVGVRETGREGTSVPFIGEIEAEGPRGEVVKIRALVDDGALVCAMCTEMYEGVKHHIGGLKRSGKTLRMANGALVSSRGYWDGGGSWLFLFGKPLLERFAAVHDYGTDTIKIPGKTGMMTEVRNELEAKKAWDLARGEVRAVFLDPKTRATPTGGHHAPPVRQVHYQAAVEGSESVNQPENQTMETHKNEVIEDARGEDTKICKIEEARENSTGDLPSPSREVMSVEEETDEEDTDEIFFTAPEEPIEEEQGGEGTVHTGEQSETREYLPGDILRSPQREVPNIMSPHQPRDDADQIAKAVLTASTWRKAVRTIGRVIAGSIFVAAAQYGGVRLEANKRGTPHGDQRSPSREVPAPKGMMEDVGPEQPEVPTGENPSVFTRLTEPHKPERVAAVLEAVTIGPDLTQEQRGRVQAFISEFADCFALSMKEVVPIPGAEHTMNVPADATFSTKVHQRPTTPAQKVWYNGVIDEMLEAGIIEPIDPKDANVYHRQRWAQKAHQNGTNLHHTGTTAPDKRPVHCGGLTGKLRTTTTTAKDGGEARTQSAIMEGLCGHFRGLIKNYARITQPLTDLERLARVGGAGSKGEWRRRMRAVELRKEWTPRHQYCGDPYSTDDHS